MIGFYQYDRSRDQIHGYFCVCVFLWQSPLRNNGEWIQDIVVKSYGGVSLQPWVEAVDVVVIMIIMMLGCCPPPRARMADVAAVSQLGRNNVSRIQSESDCTSL